jgi:hypothetical protein
MPRTTAIYKGVIQFLKASRKYYSSTLTCTAAVAAPRSDFPWPLSDREFVYRRRLVQDGAGGARPGQREREQEGVHVISVQLSSRT